MLLNNNPDSFINKQIKNAVFRNMNNNNINNNNDINNNNIDFRKTFVMPELGRYTERREYAFYNKFQINTIFRYPFKLNSIIKLQKHKLRIIENIIRLIVKIATKIMYDKQNAFFALDVKKTEIIASKALKITI